MKQLGTIEVKTNFKDVSNPKLHVRYMCDKWMEHVNIQYPFKKIEYRQTVDFNILGQTKVIEGYAHMMFNGLKSLTTIKAYDFDYIVSVGNAGNLLAHSICVNYSSESPLKIQHIIARRDDDLIYLIPEDSKTLQGQSVLIIHDIASNKGILQTLSQLVQDAGVEKWMHLVIAVEQDCRSIDSLLYLFELPVFNLGPT